MPSCRTSVLLSLLLLAAGCNNEPAPSGLPDLESLRKLPVGLRVTHTPNPVRATQGGGSGRAFTWLYETKVEAVSTGLTVIEFGAFVNSNDGWAFSTYSGKPFTSEDFAEWYSCPGAVLSPGRAAVDPQNWTGGDHLGDSRTIWYFLAEDAGGNRFYGEAELQQLAELKEP